MVDRTEFLRRSELFAGAPEALLAQVADSLQEMRAGAGSTLFREGEAGDAVYLVVAGGLRMEKDGIPLMGRGRGECMGEFALIDDAPRSTSAVAAAERPCRSRTQRPGAPHRPSSRPRRRQGRSAFPNTWA